MSIERSCNGQFVCLSVTCLFCETIERISWNLVLSPSIKRTWWGTVAALGPVSCDMIGCKPQRLLNLVGRGSGQLHAFGTWLFRETRVGLDVVAKREVLPCPCRSVGPPACTQSTAVVLLTELGKLDDFSSLYLSFCNKTFRKLSSKCINSLKISTSNRNWYLGQA